MHPSEGMGDRLRAARTLNRLTQGELATRAFVSKSLISKVEAGQKPGTWDLAIAVATALKLDPVALMVGESHDTGGETGRAAAALPSLRKVIAVYDFPPEPRQPLRSLDELSREIGRAAGYRLASQYVKLAEMLPSLLLELTQAAHASTGADRARAFWLLAVGYRCADALAYKLNRIDLSTTTIDRVRWAAEQSDDPLMVATAAYVRGQTYFDVDEGYEPGLRALMVAAAEIERQTTANPKAAAVYGALHMRAAVLAAKGNKADEAWSHIEIAKAMSALVDNDVEWYYTSFGPSNVRIHEVAVAVELGDGREALRRAGSWVPPSPVPAERASHHLIDLARAQLWLADYSGAFGSLLDARRIAPQHTRTHPMAMDTMRTLVVREKRRSDSVLGMATWMGIKL